MPAPDILGIKARSKDIIMFQLINYKKKLHLVLMSHIPKIPMFSNAQNHV